MAVSAADVKKLRDETDAPMMECKGALEEAGGDYNRAKEILREKGKAAAAKRVDRATAAGTVSIKNGNKKIAGLIVECETDFVSANPDFQANIAEMAEVLLAAGKPGITVEEALALSNGGKTLKEYTEELVGKIRENIVLKQVLVLEGAEYGYYVHHDKMYGAIIQLSSSNDVAGKDIGMQVVSMKPEFLTKDQLPQDRLASELKIEKERAIQEGKPEAMAEKIAEGRVNKEFVKTVVLLEQPFFKDQGKTVGQYVGEQPNGLKVEGFYKLFVGQ